MELKNEPQANRYAPPISGAVSWARLILNTVKYSIVRFLQSQPELFDEDEVEAQPQAPAEGGDVVDQNQEIEDQGLERGDHRKQADDCQGGTGQKRGRGVRQQYIALAHKLRDYETDKFKIWETDVLNTLNSRLSQPLLFKNPNVVPFNRVSGISLKLI